MIRIASHTISNLDVSKKTDIETIIIYKDYPFVQITCDALKICVYYSMNR